MYSKTSIIKYSSWLYFQRMCIQSKLKSVLKKRVRNIKKFKRFLLKTQFLLRTSVEKTVLYQVIYFSLEKQKYSLIKLS